MQPNGSLCKMFSYFYLQDFHFWPMQHQPLLPHLEKGTEDWRSQVLELPSAQKRDKHIRGQHELPRLSVTVHLVCAERPPASQDVTQTSSTAAASSFTERGHTDTSLPALCSARSQPYFTCWLVITLLWALSEPFLRNVCLGIIFNCSKCHFCMTESPLWTGSGQGEDTTFTGSTAQMQITLAMFLVEDIFPVLELLSA